MATLRVDEIHKILRERIEQYNRKVGIENIGRVVQVGAFHGSHLCNSRFSRENQIQVGERKMSYLNY